MPQLDARRFPSLARYLELHGGRLDRYPDCLSKTHLLRELIAEGPLPFQPGSLPAEVEKILLEPLPINTWLPTMVLEAAFQAYADERFASLAAAEAWVFHHDLARFRGPLFRILMVTLRPASMLRSAGKRWAAFHRGSRLDIEVTDNTCIGRLRFPAWLYLPDSKLNFSGSFRASLVAAGADQAVVELIEAKEDLHVYQARWS